MGQILLIVVPPAPLPTSRPDCTVLVVDDDDDLRAVLAEIFADEGLGVITAANGLEALTYLRSNAPPSVVLLDLMMPEMNGAELREKMLGDATLSTIPVILLTAAHDGRRQAATLGAAAHFSKPVKIEKLLDAIRAHC